MIMSKQFLDFLKEYEFTLIRAIIVYCSFAVIIILLYGIKKLFLNKIGNPVLRYILAMAAAYALLILFNIIDIENQVVRLAFQKTRLAFGRLGTGRIEPGMVMLVVPALYSIFFIGYFKKDLSPKERVYVEWKVLKRVMLSVFANGIFAFVLLMWCNNLYNGHSVSELLALIKESGQDIDWRFLPPFVILIVLFVYLMKREHFKENKLNKNKKRVKK